MESRKRRAGLLGLALATVVTPLLAASPAAGEGAAAVAPTDEARIPSGPHTAIYNGQDSSVAEFPFIIAGLREGGTRPVGQSCTGAVVAPRKILTAAHCKDAAGEKSYLYGLDDLETGGGTPIEVLTYDKHPKYVNFDQGYDVAVVTTKQDIPVPGGKYAAFATSADTGLNAPGKTGVGVGYGKKDHNDDSRDVTVDKAEFPIRQPSACAGVGAGFKEATMICAGFPDGNPTILPGDSGGPLIVDGKVVGVASWSRSDFRWYGVWGRLNNDMGDWVKQQVGENNAGLAVNPGSVSVEPGGHVSATVTNNSTAAVELTATGLPAGAKAVFQPATVAAGQSGKVTIETAPSTPEGSYQVGISGGGQSATLGLTVGTPPADDLKLTASPSSGTGGFGAQVSTTITAAGGTGNMTLSAAAPRGVFAFFNPATVPNGGSSTLTLFVLDAPAGTYPVTVTGTTADGTTGSTTYTLTVR
ncbi:trypsin-like serine protease [Amycolatopsis sp. 195334CR]|uniref:trypsin-like serine protease n=1 Tax=Amycolatopsis sp. 195334CR TaxID=2814588 RepID=UPI001A8CB592|nr:trypsin-like serine protease [Amycolatopsis sp. 195334CR]MBN6037216.1 trypsin-like serine protease [Amycolatopsis sp. 195334CR]